MCPTEIVSFSDRNAEFEALNTQVVGFSVDSAHSHLAWSQAPRTAGGLGGNLAFPLVSDMSHTISDAYSCLWHRGHTLRATYIIDETFTVRHLSFNDDAVGRNLDEILRLVAAFQHADANPDQACPVGWTKGSKTIVTDHDKKAEYFAAANKK